MVKPKYFWYNEWFTWVGENLSARLYLLPGRKNGAMINQSERLTQDNFKRHFPLLSPISSKRWCKWSLSAEKTPPSSFSPWVFCSSRRELRRQIAKITSSKGTPCDRDWKHERANELGLTWREWATTFHIISLVLHQIHINHPSNLPRLGHSRSENSWK